MSGNIGGGRLIRVCDLCGGCDDHPRHVIAGGDPKAKVIEQPGEDIVAKVLEAAKPEDRARLLRDLMDVSSSDRHLDCCREAGCPDGTCDVVTAGAESKRGADLLKHIVNQAGE